MPADIDPREDWIAPAGTTWVCPSCGKSGKERDRIGDVACFMGAVLCREESIERDDTGRVVRAEAMGEGEV